MTLPPRIFVIGDADRAEMSEVRTWFQAVSEHADIVRFNQLPHAADTVPDLIIVAQSWPDEFSAADVNAVLGRWPLTQWVICFGAWCESDGRTRSVWPIGLRVPARTASSRLSHVWDIVTGRRSEPLPITASRDEAFEFDLVSFSASPAAINEPSLCNSVFVDSPDPAIQSWLEQLARSKGASHIAATAAELPHGGRVLWDVDPDFDESVRNLKQFCQQHPDARVVAVVGLAHPEVIEQLRTAGAEQVVTKAYASSEMISARQTDTLHAKSR